MPLDVFGGETNEPIDSTADPQPQPGERLCTWCQEPVAGDADACPACGALLPVDHSPALPGQALAVDSEPVVVPPQADPDTVCQWCGKPAAATDEVCSTCHGRLRPIDAMAGEAYGAEVMLAPDPDTCQWCSAAVAPEDENCPICGGIARGDTSQVLPGITVPLSEEQLAAMFHQEMVNEPDDVTDTIVRIGIKVVQQLLP